MQKLEDRIQDLDNNFSLQKRFQNTKNSLSKYSEKVLSKTCPGQAWDGQDKDKI